MSLLATVRAEHEVFQEIRRLCGRRGYVHAIAAIATRENVELHADDKLLSQQPSEARSPFERILRTEIATLLGLLVSHDIDYAYPGLNAVSEYVALTDKLLRELHSILTTEITQSMFNAIKSGGESPFKHGAAFREPIFYGGESAYAFQYREFAKLKYQADSDWLARCRGFTIQDACLVAHSIEDIQSRKVVECFALPDRQAFFERLLASHTTTEEELGRATGLEEDVVRSVLNAFCLPPAEMNQCFAGLSDFNMVTAYPLLRMPNEHYLLLQVYSLYEAIYDSPFYWMLADDTYRSVAMQNRGRFAEDLVADRLAYVFGTKRVFKNVDICRNRGARVGEIDVLVVFADRAIVVQAKSKKMTVEARKGNDNKLKDDFKKSVQDSYRQGFACAQLLIDENCGLFQGQERLSVTRHFKRIYVVCAVSDSYPALNSQVESFLEVQRTDVIADPIVTEVFAIDAMAELLDSPVLFLDYLEKRARYAERLSVFFELTALGFHLSQNLWFDDKEADHITLGEDLSLPVDQAMTARRTGRRDERDPAAKLRGPKESAYRRVFRQLEEEPNGTAVDVGQLLLSMNSDARSQFSQGITDVVTRVQRDGGRLHDLSMALGDSGITVHCSLDPEREAALQLRRHCEARKYASRRNRWFGMLILPDLRIRHLCALEHSWEADAGLDAQVRDLRQHGAPVAAKQIKVGRNDPCGCGSGLKYKKCCLR